MCGRTATYISPQRIRRLYNPETADFGDWEPSYNESPGGQKPVLMRENGQRQIQTATWNFVPSSAEPSSWSNANIINARIESLREKDTFAEDWKRGGRALVPVNGFFEWKDGQPFYFTRENSDKPFLLAAVHAKNEQTEERHFAVITEPASPEMKKIHSRQPVIIHGEAELRDQFLTKGFDNRYRQQESTTLPNFVHHYPVSKTVSSPESNGEKCIEKINTLQS